MKTQCEGLDLIPADKNLVAANLDLVDDPEREYRLKRVLDPVRDRYQYILIDCPPALDLLTLNALVAADLSFGSHPTRVFRFWKESRNLLTRSSECERPFSRPLKAGRHSFDDV